MAADSCYLPVVRLAYSLYKENNVYVYTHTHTHTHTLKCHKFLNA